MRVTVLMGGTSAERDVSIASGLRIVEALRSRSHDVTAFDTARGIIKREDEARVAAEGMKVKPPSLDDLAKMERTSLSPSLGTVPAVRDAEVVFLALHGGQGEDGTIQALLDLSGVRYTGSGHLSSALAMDKDLSKQLFRAAGVMTADWLMAPASPAQVERELALPVIVKPSKQGSTVGLTLVRKSEELVPAVKEARRYDDEVMIEAYVPGRELTVSVLGDQALPVGEIIPKHEIYDYECKYTVGMAVEEFPAKLARDEAERLQALALRAYRALKLSGYGRIDFRRRDDGVSFCLEANTLPGMTELSLMPQAAQAAGISFSELCERIVYIAMSAADRP